MTLAITKKSITKTHIGARSKFVIDHAITKNRRGTRTKFVIGHPYYQNSHRCPHKICNSQRPSVKSLLPFYFGQPMSPALTLVC